MLLGFHFILQGQTWTSLTSLVRFSVKLQPGSRVEKYFLAESHQQGSPSSLEAELGKGRLGIYSLLTFLDGCKEVEDV